MFGSCRMCFSPTDKWQDFCNECATRDVPERDAAPRLRVIRGGKSHWERPSSRKKGQRWLTPVSSPSPDPPEV
jgi:hypothetical protein